MNMHGSQVQTNQEVAAMQIARSGGHGILSALFSLVVDLQWFVTQVLRWLQLNLLRQLLVSWGCLRLFGKRLSTVSAHLLFCQAKGASAPSAEQLAEENADPEATLYSGPRCACYSRYSSALQDKNSIEEQQHQCAQSALRNNHQISAELQFVDEAISGTKLERSGLNALLEAAKHQKFDVVYFFSLSRLARESVIGMRILKELVYVHEVRFISVSEGIDSQNDNWTLISSIQSIQHEQYVKSLAADVHRGQEQNVLNGKAVGDHCFGYRSEPIPGTQPNRTGKQPKQYAIDPQQAQWVKNIFSWYVDEERSIRWITRELNRVQVQKPHRSSKPKWHHDIVRRILRNTKYIGIWPWGEKKNTRNPLTGQIRQESRPAQETKKWTRKFPELRIIADEVFYTAQDMLARNEQQCAKHRQTDGKLLGSPQARKRSASYLSGLIECAACGGKFYIGGTNGRYLFCPNHRLGKCNCRTQLPLQLAEKLIVEQLSKLLLKEEDWKLLVYQTLIKSFQNQQTRLPQQLKEKRRQLDQVKHNLERLMDLVEAGSPASCMLERIHSREQEQAQLQRELKHLEQESSHPLPQPSIAWVEDQLHRTAAMLREGSPSAARALRRLVGEKVVVEELPHPYRQRKYFRGRFRPQVSAALAAYRAWCHPNEVEELPISDEIVIDFLEPDQDRILMEQAAELESQGYTDRRIGEELGCSKAKIRKLRQRRACDRGQECNGHRKKRGREEPAYYERITEPVMDLYDQGLPLSKIASEIGCDRNTITKVVRRWHEQQGLVVPDGRNRRKQLNQKAP